MHCYINIENLSEEGDLRLCYEELDSVEDRSSNLNLVSCSENYLVIRYYYEEFNDVKDLCSSIAVILLELGIYKFSILYEG